MKENKITTVLKVNENEVRILRVNNEDYISLTDLAKYKNPKEPSDVIKKWMSNFDSIEFIGLWEELNNPDFNSAEFLQIKNEAPKKSFIMTPNNWCKSVNAIGIIAGKGKYSLGTFAHSDIALEFASWIDTSFKLYLIKEFQRLKYNESYQNKIEWSVRRLLSKTNYKIHTDSIKENLILPELTKEQINYMYVSEADMLNVALFGMRAKEFKEKYPKLIGNLRDNTDINHLIVLSNLENINAILIEQGFSQQERIIKLNEIARKQLKILAEDLNIKNIKEIETTIEKEKVTDKIEV